MAELGHWSGPVVILKLVCISSHMAYLCHSSFGPFWGSSRTIANNLLVIRSLRGAPRRSTFLHDLDDRSLTSHWDHCMVWWARMIYDGSRHTIFTTTFSLFLNFLIEKIFWNNFQVQNLERCKNSTIFETNFFRIIDFDSGYRFISNYWMNEMRVFYRERKWI